MTRSYQSSSSSRCGPVHIQKVTHDLFTSIWLLEFRLQAWRIAVSFLPFVSLAPGQIAFDHQDVDIDPYRGPCRWSHDRVATVYRPESRTKSNFIALRVEKGGLTSFRHPDHSTFPPTLFTDLILERAKREDPGRSLDREIR